MVAKKSVKLSKKGQFFHYLPLIMMVGLGIFLMFFISTNTKEAIQEKGVATSSFLEVVREVQKRQLQIEYSADQVAKNVLESYFDGDISSTCGEIDGVRMLIGSEQYCSFNVDEYLGLFVSEFELEYNSSLYPAEEINTSSYNQDELIDYSFLVNLDGIFFESDFQIKAPKQEFEYFFEEGVLYGVGSEKITYKNPIRETSYSIEPYFDVKLGVDLDSSFSDVFSKSIALVSACANSELLEDCLDEKMKDPEYDVWKYGVCDSLGYTEGRREVAFCVESDVQIFNTNSGVVETLNYSFGLDFTPLEAFVVENVDVSYEPEYTGFDIWFDAEDTASSYKIYITDYEDLDFMGTKREFELRMFSDNFIDSVEISVDSLETICTDTPVAGVGYDCLEQIRYVYSEVGFDVSKSHYFAVTSLIDGKESLINRFVSSD